MGETLEQKARRLPASPGNKRVEIVSGPLSRLGIVRNSLDQRQRQLLDEARRGGGKLDLRVTAFAGVGLMYLASVLHTEAAGAVIAAPHSEYRPARSIPVGHTQIGSQFSMPQTGDDDFDAMMRQQFAQAQAQMQAALREMQDDLNHIPASRTEHRSITRRQVFRGRARDDDDDDDDDNGDGSQGQHYPPPAPQLVTPPPASASSPDDVGWWDCIIGLFAIALTVGIVVRCINFARSCFGPPGAVTKAPMFAPPTSPYQPAWQPKAPTYPAWSAKPAGPVFYDIPE